MFVWLEHSKQEREWGRSMAREGGRDQTDRAIMGTVTIPLSDTGDSGWLP